MGKEECEKSGLRVAVIADRFFYYFSKTTPKPA